MIGYYEWLGDFFFEGKWSKLFVYLFFFIGLYVIFLFDNFLEFCVLVGVEKCYYGENYKFGEKIMVLDYLVKFLVKVIVCWWI